MLASCARTGRLLVVHEAVQAAGFGAEIAASAAEATGCRVARLGAPRIPVGYSPVLEAQSRVGAEQIVAARQGLVQMNDDAGFEDSVFFKLVRVVNLTARPFQQRVGRQHQLTLNEWRTMAVLGAQPGLTATQLCELHRPRQDGGEPRARGVEAPQAAAPP